MKRKGKTTTSTSKKSGVESRIKPVDEIDDPLNLAFYGRSGTGKTTISGTLPKPMLVGDVRDRGTRSIKKRKGIFVYPIRSVEDFEELYWYLEANPDKYKSLSLDTITQLAQMVIAKFKGSGKMSRRVYGDTSSYLNPWIIKFAELPIITSFIAQEKLFGGSDDAEDDEIVPEMGLSIMPSIAVTINAAVDVIGNTFIRETSKKVKTPKGMKTETISEYCMRIGPHARYLTKLRRDPALGGEVPQIMVNPTYEKIIELMEED